MTTCFTKREREIWRPRRRLSVSQWADEHFRLPSTDPKPGRWRTNFMPFQREVLDAFSDPTCEEIVVQSGAQCGKSRMIEIMGSFTVCELGVDLLHFVPRDLDIKTLVKGRLRPLIDQCPELGRQITDSPQDLTFEQLRFAKCSWYTGASNSAASMAQKTTGVVLLDEIGKFPGVIKLEGSPISLIIQRTNAFEGRRKIVKVSTPTREGHGISVEYAKSDRRQFFVPCHRCGTFQVLAFTHVKWPDHPSDVDLDQWCAEISREKLAWYECEACGEHWTDADKRRQCKLGKYVQKGAEIDDDGQVHGAYPSSVRGFHWPGLLSSLRTFSDFASRFLKAQSSTNAQHDLGGFFRGDIGVPWQNTVEEITVEGLERNIEPGLAMGSVPEGDVLLCAGADVGKHACHWCVWAFGWGMSTPTLVARGIAATVAELELILSLEFGEKNVIRVFVDSGWEEKKKAAKVERHPIFEFVNRFRSRAWASRGFRELSSGKPIEVRQMDATPGGKPLPGGFKRAAISTTFFKDLIAERRGLEVDDPRCVRIPEDVGDDFIEQLASEHKIEDEAGAVFWEPRGGVPNHYWDATVYAWAAGWSTGRWKVGPKESKPRAQPRARPDETGERSRVEQRGEQGRRRQPRGERRATGGLAGARGSGGRRRR